MLTKTAIAKMAKEIANWLEKNNLSQDVCIYFNDKVWRSKTEWKGGECVYSWAEEININPQKYFKYAASAHILSMSFEGPLYNCLNYGDDKKESEFNKILSKYGLYKELGDSWNLTCFSISDEEVEYTFYDSPKEEIIYLSYNNAPYELEEIMNLWFELSKAVGNCGSCVLGAGFNFKFNGKKYFMPAQSPYQGSLSWEKPKDVIKDKLESIKATEISYDWGNMD